MNEKELINTSKRMVVEYYNRYVQNVEPDMSDIKIDIDNVKLIDKFAESGDIRLVLQVEYDVWILYNVEANNGIITRSYITLN